MVIRLPTETTRCDIQWTTEKLNLGGQKFLTCFGWETFPGGIHALAKELCYDALQLTQLLDILNEEK